MELLALAALLGLIPAVIGQRKNRSFLACRTREEDTARIETVISEVASIAARYQVRVVVDQHLPGTVVHLSARHGILARVRPWTAESRTQAAQAVRARI